MSSKDIVIEGWLTKSPPTKRIWRTRWRRRWFALRQSGELPGQYILDYYADRNRRRLKGSINLDLCEQVDAGLHMERTGNGTFDPKLRGSVFTIQTQQRTYHLEADCEADMENWVDAICRVCGLRSTEEPPTALETYQNTTRPLSQSDSGDATGPYIPISECITGVRAQGFRTRTETFSLNSKGPMGPRVPLKRVINNKNLKVYKSHPHIRTNNTDHSENDSNVSDEECKSLTASQSNIGDFSVAKTFTKLSIAHEPPEPPPRPPKTFTKDFHVYQGPKFQEHVEVHESPVNRCKRSPVPAAPASSSRFRVTPVRTTDDEDDGVISQQPQPTVRPLRSPIVGVPLAPSVRPLTTPARITDDEDECVSTHQAQYCNLSTIPLSAPRTPLPPAVDRALKPRHSSVSHISQVMAQVKMDPVKPEDNDSAKEAHKPVASSCMRHRDTDSNKEVHKLLDSSSTIQSDGDSAKEAHQQVASSTTIQRKSDSAKEAHKPVASSSTIQESDSAEEAHKSVVSNSTNRRDSDGAKEAQKPVASSSTIQSENDSAQKAHKPLARSHASYSDSDNVKEAQKPVATSSTIQYESDSAKEAYKQVDSSSSSDSAKEAYKQVDSSSSSDSAKESPNTLGQLDEETDYVEINFPPMPDVDESGPKSVPMTRQVKRSEEAQEPVASTSTDYRLKTCICLPPRAEGATYGRNIDIVTDPTQRSGQSAALKFNDEMRADLLHYLDLDLPCTDNKFNKDDPSKPMFIIHGRSQSASEPEADYKTVDFVKTEAFNITRQDAEALRLEQN